MSAPQVSGVATIIAAMRPGIDNELVRSILCAGAEDEVGDALDTPGFDNYYGWGRLNAYHSLVLAHTALRHSETSGTPVLSWNASPNAADKNPYCVQVSTNLANGQFLTVTRTNITYVGTQAYYSVQGTTDTHAIYRLGISRQ